MQDGRAKSFGLIGKDVMDDAMIYGCSRALDVTAKVYLRWKKACFSLGII